MAVRPRLEAREPGVLLLYWDSRFGFAAGSRLNESGVLNLSA